MKKKKKKIESISSEQDNLENSSLLQKREDFRLHAKNIIVNIFKNLFNNKLYLFSFIIVMLFFGYTIYNKINSSEGLYFSKASNSSGTEVSTTVDSNLSNSTSEVDISDYVGIYSREINLNEDITLSNSCTIDSYELVYRIKRDKSITKYFYSECFGTIKLWSDTLSYDDSSNTKYLSANDINFLLASGSIKEVDGETYIEDDDITSLKEKTLLKNVSLDVYGNNFIFLTVTNIIQVKGNTVNFNLNSKYMNNGGSLEKYIYKNDNTYKFIIFSNGEDNNCYDNNKSNSELYSIYEITFDKDKEEFGEAKKIITRTYSDGCDNLEEDLATLES